MIEWDEVASEPTKEMIEAGMNAFIEGEERLMSEWVRGMWIAMREASPHRCPQCHGDGETAYPPFSETDPYGDLVVCKQCDGWGCIE